MNQANVSRTNANTTNGRRISSLGTVRTFFQTGTCSETLCNVLDRAYDQPLRHEEHAAMPLAGGIMAQGYQCGQLWGAALAAGARAYQIYGPGPRAEAAAITAAQRVVQSFWKQNKEINCLELTHGVMKSGKADDVFRFFIKGGPIRCFSMSARTAKAAYREINTALAEVPVDAPPHPVSCAAVLARKMGASELQATMAAGLAGGIGLSGGACGALGAAVWIISMQYGEASFSIGEGSPRSAAAQERFLESADYEFECEKIVGRRFADASDHAAYVCGGGCGKIIAALAGGEER